MLPLAPARLSTITGWPSTEGSALAMRRVMVSAPPPGELGTMHRIGLTGNACPQPAAAHMHVTTAIAMSFSLSSGLFIPLLLSLFGYLAPWDAMATTAGLPERLLQEWLVPLWMTNSPALTVTSCVSRTSTISPSSTMQKSKVRIFCHKGCGACAGY